MANRRDYYFRQLVSQAELDDGFDQLERAERRIMEDAVGFGFITSAPEPATVEENTVPDLQVIANALLGYDQEGRRLSNVLSGFVGGVDQGAAPQVVNMAVDEVAASTAVGAPGNEKTLTIFVEFERKLTDPRTDGNGATVFFKQDESVKFNVVQSAEAAVGTSVPPPARTDQLILADVVLVFGQTTILNADISQSRRQDFALKALHGGSHVEGGADPIPNATGAVGGLLSAADKTKLDGIDFTASGIGTTVAKTKASFFQPTNIVAPAATSLDVTGSLVGKTPGGTDTVEGVVTTGPNNIVLIRRENGDDFVDPNTGGGGKVQGRLTEAAGVWTLSFFVLDEATGAETPFDMTPFSGTNVVWFVLETWLLHNQPTFDSSLVIPSDQVAAEVPTATDAIAGKVKIESDGVTTGADVALGTDDARTGAVQGRANAGAVTGYQPVVRLIDGTGVSISLVEAGGELQFTINATGSFPGFGGVPNPDSAAGSAGAAGTASRSDHAHPASTIYNQVASTQFSGLGANLVVVTGFTPKLLVVVYEGSPGDAAGVGIAHGTGATQQGTMIVAPGAVPPTYHVAGIVARGGVAGNATLSTNGGQFDSTNVTAVFSAGGGITFDGTAIVIGGGA